MKIKFPRVVIRGAGDLASGCALRLQRAGFTVVLTEVAQPLAVRRTVSFAQAVFDGSCQVEEVVGRCCTAGQALAVADGGEVPVVVDPAGQLLRQLRPAVVVDAIMAKRNLGTCCNDAALVIALGPGFTAGVDCHAVVETDRGHSLGRLFWQGSALPDTGEPGEVAGQRGTRVLRAPADGQVAGCCAIGDSVAAGEIVALLRTNDGTAQPIRAPFAGILRGLIHPTVGVRAGTKIGDLDPRAERAYCFTVSDKALAVAGGVLEGILTWMAQEGAE
ncbi:MAG: selenium-dependent molybdenum cofactor biosynthesis protein YqeB [Caldilinea sp.]|jgi:xanthine dehydrogenase accessory factor